MLSNKDLVDVFKSHQDGLNAKAREYVITNASFLVYKNTKKYIKFSNYEDLMQEGFIGLIRAVDKYDHTKFPNFLSYAEQWVVHYIRKAAKRFDVVYSPDRVRTVYAELDEDTEDTELTPDQHYFKKESAAFLLDKLSCLSSRNNAIVKSVYGIGCDARSLRDIGKDFEISHERVRQIKDESLHKLKQYLLCSEIN